MIIIISIVVRPPLGINLHYRPLFTLDEVGLQLPQAIHHQAIRIYRVGGYADLTHLSHPPENYPALRGLFSVII